ncbi:MAG: hypothetical protein KAI33_11235, partial [Elusimicrobiales bacterium]|nr:hypothetical protein [Elusimicrobiales bacterium]
ERYSVRTYESKLGTHTVKVALGIVGGNWWNGSDFAVPGTITWFEVAVDTAPYVIGDSTVSWVYNMPQNLLDAMSSIGTKNYRIVTWAYDLAENREFGPGTAGVEPVAGDIPAQVGVYINLDNEKPITTIDVPDLTYHNTLPDISGTADDPNNGITEIRFTIYNTDIFKYYDPSLNPPWSIGGESENDAPWVLAQATIYQTSAAWTYNIEDSTWVAAINHNYRVRAKSKDTAGNWDITYSTAEFKFDSDAPISTVTAPSNGSYLNGIISNISGNSTDPNSGSGVLATNIYIIRGSDGKYWSGGSWEIGAQPLPVSNPDGDWSKPADAAMFTGNDGEIFNIHTNAQDNATNVEGYNLRSSFVYDISKPTASITYPYDSSYINQGGKITGDSYDKPNGMVENVYVRIKQTDGSKKNHYWRISDSSWTVEDAPDVWNDVISSGTLSASATWWQLGTTPWQSGETYEINMYAKDKADNYEAVYSTVTNIGANFTVPSSTVTYPAHGSTINVELTAISGSASDVPPGVLEKVEVSYYKVDDP